MSHSAIMMGGMKTRIRTEVSPAVQLVWPHDGALHRVGPWPEARFERQVGELWVFDDPSEDSLASAAVALSPGAWSEYLEYVPVSERVVLGRFRAGRIAALQVLARCPDLVTDLIENPALAAIIAAHRSLRGTASSRWAEISAIYERRGVFGVLEWLGLPSSRQTLAILRQIADPDLPVRLLEPLRASLWEPETIWDLQHASEITSRLLERYCHALAA